MNNFNEKNNPNYGPILPHRDNNPIYINQKFEHEGTYTDRPGGLYDNIN